MVAQTWKRKYPVFRLVLAMFFVTDDVWKYFKDWLVLKIIFLLLAPENYLLRLIFKNFLIFFNMSSCTPFCDSVSINLRLFSYVLNWFKDSCLSNTCALQSRELRLHIKRVSYFQFVVFLQIYSRPGSIRTYSTSLRALFTEIFRSVYILAGRGCICKQTTHIQ